MAKHKKLRENVFFKHKGHLFKLLEAINFGTKSSPVLKIKGVPTHVYKPTFVRCLLFPLNGGYDDYLNLS